MRNLILYFVFFIFCFSACRREELSFPHILIESPSENSTFFAGDTILVAVKANFDEKIDYLKLSLTNASWQNSAVPLVYYPVTTNEVYHTFSMVLGTNTLQSGKYFLIAEAISGNVSSKDYLTVFLQRTKRKALSFFVFTSQHNSQSNIFKLDSLDGNFTHFASPNGDFINGRCNSANGQVATIGKYSGAFNVYSFPNAVCEFSISGIPDPPFYTFEGFQNMGNQYLLQYNDGKTSSYNNDGILLFSFSTAPYRSILTCFQDENLCAIQYKDLSSPIRFSDYYFPTGFLVWAQQIFFETIALLPLDTNIIVLIANNESIGQIYLVDLFFKTITKQNLNYSNFGQFTSAVHGSDGKIFISDENQIYSYDPAAITFEVFFAGQSADYMAYDSVNNLILGAKGHDCFVISCDTKQVLRSELFQDSIKSVDIMYNY